MSKLRDAILGFIVGDAFGVPYEFKKRGTFEVNKNMIGYGTHNQPPGTWSDDSSMMLATLYSIIYKEDIMTNFLKWYNKGKFTPYGQVFDIGGRTDSALNYFYEYGNIMPDDGEIALGNGSLMRILPLAFYDHSHADIDMCSALTHPARICKQACRIYINIIKNLLDNYTMEDALFEIKKMFTNEFDRLNYIHTLSIEDIKSTGYVVDTLEAAIWSMINTNSYKDAIMLATSLGDDTDTIAALTGAMAGIYYGAKSIPEQWLFNIARLDDIENLIQKSQDEVIF